MNCEIARQKLFDRLDCKIDAETGGLTPTALYCADAELEKHLAECAGCRREYGLLSLPRAAAAAQPPLTASAWFYRRLCRRIEDEARCRAGRQAVRELAYRMIPALAGITLTLASIFAWQQARPSAATPRNYEYVFISDEAARHMLADDQNDITYESVLAALAERQADNFPGMK